MTLAPKYLVETVHLVCWITNDVPVDFFWDSVASGSEPFDWYWLEWAVSLSHANSILTLPPAPNLSLNDRFVIQRSKNRAVQNPLAEVMLGSIMAGFPRCASLRTKMEFDICHRQNYDYFLEYSSIWMAPTHVVHTSNFSLKMPLIRGFLKGILK